ncbi:hypothetical protein DL764_002701 [Monosporascus ibericus]|uniref:PH-response regulator protein palI/RIM9 n=1 Tax=Monosporascus ibericus TaxID=155417 RepID=A0A4Q4TLY7_9PEZI|nr:hypothetical protein DL764_002701 [Monosporascus ibericus]
MLRPATPLSILLFAAFVLLLLSVISTPIIKSIPLGIYEGYSFGVFGYCELDRCSPFEIGYDTSRLASFDLPASTRTTLSMILIVHPIACFLTLVMLVMALVAHVHAPSHSPRYLLIVFIFGIFTFVASLLSFLIDVLLFVPHMAWGSYIVLAATILVCISLIVSCAMRRTLVSRKARKKRIEENAEMSGENYYNRQAQQEAAAAALAPTIPSVDGGTNTDKLPTFATYDQKKDDHSSDERVPLTATSSERQPNNMPLHMNTPDTAYSGPRRSGSTPSLPSDPYGNPSGQPQDGYAMRRGPSFEHMNARGRGGSPGSYRGRGGYGRGGYGPPPNGRGGYGPPGRGGYGQGPPNGRGGYGPGPNGRGGGYGPRGGYAAAGMRGGRAPPGYPGGGPYDRRPPPDAYGNYPPAQQTPGPSVSPYDMNAPIPSVSTGSVARRSYEAYNPDRVGDLPRAESPPPLPGTDGTRDDRVGQAVEMDASTRSPAHTPPNFDQFNQLRESDSDVAGMLALQQARTSSDQRHDTYMSESSKYSQDEHYAPPRQAWNQGPGRSSPGFPAPLNTSTRLEELPENTVTAPPQRAHSDAGDYYEDIPARFAEPAPSALQPGQDMLGTYEDVHAGAGARSPAISERSGFTSVSQRGVNPYWTPAPGPGYGQQVPPRRPVGRNDVNVLNSNPDFQLPSSRGLNNSSPARGPGGGMVPGSAYPV